MSIREIARSFFEACETGKGWEVCRQWCRDDASFFSQADALVDIETLASYTEWTKGILVPIPDGHYELKAFAVDEDRQVAVAASVFHGTHSADAGNGPPSGKTVATDYCYVMQFDGEKISHMTKIWNDGYALRQLGWA